MVFNFNSPQSVSTGYGSYGGIEREPLPPWVVEQLRKVIRRLHGSLAGSSLGRSPYSPGPDEMMIVDRAMLKLHTMDSRLADVLRYQVFMGQSEQETASSLGLSRAAVEQDWRRAKLWFYRYLQQEVVQTVDMPS